MNLFHISFRNMRIRLLSTGLTTVSIAMGTALLASLWLLMAEAKDRYSASTTTASYSLIVGPKEGSPLELVLNTVFNYGISQGLVPYSLYRDLHSGKLRRKGLVRYAIPQSRGDSYKNYPIIGTTDEMFLKFRTRVERVIVDGKATKKGHHLEFAQGTHFDFSHDDLEKFVTGLEAEAKRKAASGEAPVGHSHEPIPVAWRKAVIGAGVARTLGMGVGSKFIPLHGTSEDPLAHEHREAECTVVGVLARTGTPLDRSIYIPLNVFLSMDKHDAIRKTKEQIAENVGLSAIILNSVRPTGANMVRSYLQDGDQGQGALPFNEIQRLLQIVGDSTDILEILSLVVLLVTASTVLLALYNTMNERRREIAIMRSLGARRGQIFRIILQEALLISLSGAVLGVAVCHFSVYLLSDYILRRTGISVDWTVYSVRELALVFGVGVLGAAAGVLPAWKGARVPVAENLGPTS